MPAKTSNYTCFYAASTSRRMHAIALNKARKLQITSPARCRLTYLQFAGEFARGVTADCLQFCVELQVLLPAIVKVFLPAIPTFLPANCMYFCLQRLVASKFAQVPHVKLPVKYPWYSGKITCTCRQFACILREVLDALTQVNLPVFTGKLHVTQVNCVWGLFTCELQVKLPAFAGNFTRASFRV